MFMMAMIEISMRDDKCIIYKLMKLEIVVHMITHDYTQDYMLPFLADCLLRRVHTIPIMRPTITPTTSIPTPVLAVTTIMPELLESVSTNIQGKRIIIPQYKTLVRPHLEYCIQTWKPYRKKDINKLERVQRRATKMLPKLRNISYEMYLKQRSLTTLETGD